MLNFIDETAETYNITKGCLVYDYIIHKTKASDRGSKARRSLGNLYALYVICEDYLAGNQNGSNFTYLMGKMKAMPFGSKLQNHPLDNRLNGEVHKKFQVADKYHPVIATEIDGKKARKVSIDFLTHGHNNAENSAYFIIEVIDEYIDIIEVNQNEYLVEVESATTNKEIIELMNKAFQYEADARLFEIVSHALLYLHYKKASIFIGNTPQTVEPKQLILYKTGRTNANDGGIDFVLQPLGRFFQVTETLDFKKYFLDLDKMNRFPITFVIKTDLPNNNVLQKIRNDASKIMAPDLLEHYLGLFEEVITLNELKAILNEVSQSQILINELKETVISNYKLEYGLLD